MNLLELGCDCLTTPYLKAFMDLVSHPGRGEVAVLLGVAVWLYGFARADHKAKKLAYAILIALTAIAVITVALKLSLQLPRPTPRSGYGFPSGDSATVFGLASAAAVAYPLAAPLFYFLATLTAIARLYFRAHFVWDVIGGALIGALCGFASARKLIGVPARKKKSLVWPAAWAPCIVLAGLAIGFFLSLEREISRHKITAGARLPGHELQRIDFGTAQARPALIGGWASDGVWRSENFPFSWAEGLKSSVSLNVDSVKASRLLLHAYPYRPSGFLCQRIGIAINGVPIDQVWLEQDWQRYALQVPERHLSAGANRLDFTFVYADRSNWHGMNPQGRPLSVAFHKVQLLSR